MKKALPTTTADMRPNLFLLLLLCSQFLAVAAFGQGGREMNLQQAIDYALANTNEIRNGRLAIEDAEAQIVEARSRGLPQLSAGANFNHYLQVPKQPLPEPFVVFLESQLPPGEMVDREASFFLKNNLTTSINGSFLLFDGSYFVGLQAAKAARAYAGLDMARRVREVTNSVQNAYLPVLLIRENLQQLDKNIANLEKLLFETRQVYEAGFAEQLDVDRLELSVANLRTERENLQRQEEIALRGLKYTINYPLEEPIDITDNLDSMRVAAVADDLEGAVVLERRPELAVLDQAITLNELNIRNIRSGYLPSLRGNAAYQYQYQGDNLRDGFWAPTALVGLSLNIPIFDGLSRRAQVQRARIDLEEYRLQRNDLVRAIRLEVQNARTNYRNARERLQSAERNVQLAERIYETTQIKYREGVGSSVEVTQAEQGLYETQTNYLQALYDLLVARTNLEQALGK